MEFVPTQIVVPSDQLAASSVLPWPFQGHSPTLPDIVGQELLNPLKPGRMVLETAPSSEGIIHSFIHSLEV